MHEIVIVQRGDDIFSPAVLDAREKSFLYVLSSG
jgi:hypothetical protein